MTYRQLFKEIEEKGFLDKEVAIADDGNGCAGAATLLFVQEDSRLGDTVAETMGESIGFPFLIL